MILKKLLESIFQFFQHKVRKTKFLQTSLITKELIKHENKFNSKVFHGRKKILKIDFHNFHISLKASKRVLGQLPPRKTALRIIAPRIIASWMIAHQIIALGQLLPKIIVPEEDSLRTTAPRTITSQDNCPRGRLPPHHKISPKNSCPHPSNFPSKSTRVLRVN